MSSITDHPGGVSLFVALTGRVVLALLLLSLHQASGAQQPKMLRIGVIGNESLQVFERSQKGFEAAMDGAGFKEGVNVVYDRRNTSGSPEKTLAIGRAFATDKVDLIHSFGTSATLAAMTAAPDIPVVFTAVSDPVSAGVVPRTSAEGQPTGTHTTGVSDLWPMAEQLAVYAKIHPKAKKWGILYNPAENGSIKLIRETAKGLGLELFEVTVSNTGEVGPAVASLAGKVQALYIPAGSTVGAEYKTIAEISERNRMAYFTGTAPSVSRGALAAYGVDYFLVGYAAGKKASLVLKGIKPGSIPWDRGGNFGLIVNRQAARQLGIAIPAEMLRIADKVIE